MSQNILLELHKNLTTYIHRIHYQRIYYLFKVMVYNSKLIITFQNWIYNTLKVLQKRSFFETTVRGILI